ncbi:nitrite reductase small subunit NirD [Aeromonas veronii]|uniref:nitrite reductase small subunit NirD n=1 Tax=Aeromonas veronii TaxID=654 RepID=UPI0038E67DA9
MTTSGIAWLPACELTQLEEGVGRSLRVADRVVALFRCGGEIYALDGMDPVAGVAVMDSGLVGDCQGEPMVASPLYKQRYSLRDGRCLDNPALGLRPWPIKIEEGQVWLAQPDLT